MAGIFKLDEILDAREDIERVRLEYRTGARSRDNAAQALMQYRGYGWGDAYTILDDETGK